ncbi:MAG: carbohydrate porin [Myxococcales bacterium]
MWLLLAIEIAWKYQATVATQAHPAFDAAYSGKNSLGAGAESTTSVVMDLSAEARLWPGATLTLAPELAGGKGLSSTLGVAAFPSGEVYRVGNPEPTLILARAALTQSLGDVTLIAGKVAVTDTFDSVPVSNDPHTRFMSWGLWASAAYDYPADTHGYTWGVSADYKSGWWSARAGAFLEPKSANGVAMEWNVAAARGLVAEFEGRWSDKGGARILAFLNTAHMGSYDEAATQRKDIADTRADGRVKGGFAASANQDFGDGLQAFARASFNDGANETWAFTEIDRSFAVGVVKRYLLWEGGVAAVISGLSGQHRAYLAGGGSGFLIGDGALRYGPEILGEIYCRVGLTPEISVGANYQPILNPAFNQDRGPVHVFTARAHVAF